METSLVKLIQEKKLFEKNEKIIVALSGGVDSMVLFNVLYELNKNIIIAHINHKARSVSDDEFIKIKEFAKKCNVPFEGFVITEKLNNNFHQDARDQRYNFFKAIAQKQQVKKIFLAHHQDDQVETILMRLVRGTSFGGYAGIPIEKLVLGVPFYGRWWQGTHPNNNGLYQNSTGKRGSLKYKSIAVSLSQKKF